jgi:hypothetical protein
MANSVIDNPTDIRTDRQCILIGMTLEENRFATVPMPAACLPWTPDSELAKNRFATVPMAALSPAHLARLELEEVWHTSFEQAISDRAARISQQLRHLSTTSLDHAIAVGAPEPIAARTFLARPRHFLKKHRRAIILFCLGLGLFLLGFDLMGLLVIAR